ncbi:MAG: hypothetical protein EBS01_10700, partial [Verrucomicrobia bacterium]|nr:hypothetical protein [Verrucomicrobiota bacterium]
MGTGTFTVTVNNTPPVILSQSPGVAVATGGSITLSVSAKPMSGGTLSYQWRKRYSTVSTVAGSGAPGSTNGGSLTSSFIYPSGLTSDASTGDFYIADTVNNRIRKVTSGGTVSTFAGSGLIGSGDHVTGGSATFFSPTGVALFNGTLFVADQMNNKIRKISASGAVSTFAGSGIQGGADASGTSASFYFPYGIAVDASGNLYVADTNNHKIRKITQAGVVTTFAGSGNSGSGDGTGTNASFTAPRGIAVDASGNVFVADYEDHKIRKITPEGVVTTLAGSGAQGADNGLGLDATFSHPCGLSVDASGNLYVADFDYSLVRKITPGGVVTTLAGTGNPGTDDGQGLASTFTYPQAVAVEAAGTVLVCDTYANKIRRMTEVAVSIAAGTSNTLLIPSAVGTDRGSYDCFVSESYAGSVASLPANVQVFTTSPAANSQVASGGSLTLSVAVGTGSYAAAPVSYQWRELGKADVTTLASGFSNPKGVASDANGNVYVADLGNHVIRRVSPEGDVSTLAGYPGWAGYNDAAGSSARFYNPRAVAVDGRGNVYVADYIYHVIRKITPEGSVSALAGLANYASYTDSTGTGARFNSPQGVAVDASGNVYVADTGNSKIRKITPDGVVTTIGGSATFNSPEGVAVDASGNVYVADTGSHTIRKITQGVVSTIAGTSGISGMVDGLGSSARFNTPNGLAVDAAGNVYVADYNNHTIRRITPAGVVSTLAGSPGNAGYTNASGTNATFYYPSGVAVDGFGNVYVADMYGQSVRKITQGANIASAVNATYTLSGITVTDKSYDVVVMDSSTGIRSVTSAAKVAVRQAPVIDTAKGPWGASVASGGSLTLSVSAS